MVYCGAAHLKPLQPRCNWVSTAGPSGSLWSSKHSSGDLAISVLAQLRLSHWHASPRDRHAGRTPGTMCFPHAADRGTGRGWESAAIGRRDVAPHAQGPERFAVETKWEKLAGPYGRILRPASLLNSNRNPRLQGSRACLNGDRLRSR